MGLSDLDLPQQMTNADKEYLRKYMLAHAWQHRILIRLMKYQEEMSPIQSTQCQGQQLVDKIGKSYHATAIQDPYASWPGYNAMTSAFKASKDCSHVISMQVAQYNRLLDELNKQSQPSWMPKSMQHI